MQTGALQGPCTSDQNPERNEDQPGARRPPAGDAPWSSPAPGTHRRPMSRGGESDSEHEIEHDQGDHEEEHGHDPARTQDGVSLLYALAVQG